MELLGLDGTNSIRGLSPNEEDHQDYLNGEI